MRAAFWLSFCLLLAVRLPSLAQPAGADQGLYAYVGQRILAGEVPYRDAWDQKPPAIHYTYALMYAAWPRDAIVPATDLLVAAATALLLVGLGRRLGGGIGAAGCGEFAALLFLLYGNPALTRLGGVRIRSQCEVFIALAVAGALLLIAHACRDASDAGKPAAPAPAGRIKRGPTAAAGALFALAFLYKYNAGIYLLVGAAALVLMGSATGAAADVNALDAREDQRGPRVADASHPSASWHLTARLRRAMVPLLILGTSFAAVVGIAALLFLSAGALDDLYDATITYNIFYSSETYAGRLSLIGYLVTFPIAHARLEALWFLGGLGCLVLLVTSRFRPQHWVLLSWVAAACLSIAVNGSRGLPQYFVQAGPALALAAGAAGALVWPRLKPLGRTALGVALVVAALRVTDFDKAVDYTTYDVSGWTGALSREQYLSRFGERASGDKYSALAIHELAQHFTARVPPGERVLLFGFSPGALVQSGRISATRFFWSRPVIVGFQAAKAGYGASGMLEELRRTRPVEVVLQQHDWDPDGPDSSTWFLAQPVLSAWLDANYEAAEGLGNFLIYRRRSLP